jgi:hypothetical protein
MMGIESEKESSVGFERGKFSAVKVGMYGKRQAAGSSRIAE